MDLEEELLRLVEFIDAEAQGVACKNGADDDDDIYIVDDNGRNQAPLPQPLPSISRVHLPTLRQQPLVPRVVSASNEAAGVRRPFRLPFSKGCSNSDEDVYQRLLARKGCVPCYSPSAGTSNVKLPSRAKKDDLDLPPGIDPLVLWPLEAPDCGDHNLMPIVVDPLLVRFLRPHQREGVQFMFRCVSGLQSAANIYGCILADDMGLGKTLQSITLLYTLLRQGFNGKPMVKKAIIVTPTSLVSNWEAEIKKWVGARVQLIALCDCSRGDVISGFNSFTNPRSSTQYVAGIDCFLRNLKNAFFKLTQSGSYELLICDEAHRLKNDQTITNRALASLSCKRRILLSGTPMQNDLEEFYAMVNFTYPGILGDAAHFRRYYQAPILIGREPTASAKEKMLGVERSEELSAIVNQFILRRTNALLSNHLPPKIIEVVCCKLTTLQSELYYNFLASKNVKRVITEEAQSSKILAYITALKKLCNHPKLIYDSISGGNSGISGFEDCLSIFNPEAFSGRTMSWTGGGGHWVELSGKMNVLARLLAQLRQTTDDRIVLDSNYTQTLDLFAQLCSERRYPYLRLDGSTSISKRQELVNRFNDPSKDEFAFLLSSKAGGCGLNLIGGNRLVLFDPDWNPANDKQAAARVWRDGQKKRVYIYRLLSTGTIEKVYQRQMSKEGLQKVIQQDQSDSEKGNVFSTEELRDLFTYHGDMRSEIHEKMNCLRCINSARESNMLNNTVEDLTVELMSESYSGDDIGGFAEISGSRNLRRSERQVGTPLEEDLLSWAHHLSPDTVPDNLLQASAGDLVSFVFTNQIEGKLNPVESKHPPQENRSQTNQHWSNSGKKTTHKSWMPSTGKKVPSNNRIPVRAAPGKSIGPLGDVTNLPCIRSMTPLSMQPPLKRSCHTRENDNIVCLS